MNAHALEGHHILTDINTAADFPQRKPLGFKRNSTHDSGIPGPQLQT
jgi:hypothetical protein